MKSDNSITYQGKQKVIVSLTSFPAAIPYAVQAIRSVLEGSVQPDKVVLYLDTQKFPHKQLPVELEMLEKENPLFEVRFDAAEIRSYKKLIPALRDFPDDVIVTIDDDILYNKNMLRDLLCMHERIPNAIIAHRVRRIRLGEPYRKWEKYKWYDFIFRKIHLSHLAMQTGVGGVLYPPHSLDENMLDASIFMKIAPTADDVFFWAAAVSKGTYVIPLPGGKNHPKEIGKPGELALQTVNIRQGKDLNRKTLERILAKFPIVNQIIEQR